MYRSTSGTVTGSYPDGRVAAVDNVFGKGKTRLIGSVPSYAYHCNRDAATKAFFASLLAWAGKEQHVRCSTPEMVVRLHAGEGGVYLWALNPSHDDSRATIELSSAWGPFSAAQVMWGEQMPVVKERTIQVQVGQRDAVITRLDV
jgi:beta-galactosidase